MRSKNKKVENNYHLSIYQKSSALFLSTSTRPRDFLSLNLDNLNGVSYSLQGNKKQKLKIYYKENRINPDLYVVKKITINLFHNYQNRSIYKQHTYLGSQVSNVISDDGIFRNCFLQDTTERIKCSSNTKTLNLALINVKYVR